MLIWGLDLGTHIGYAFGRAGDRPQSGSIHLREDGRSQDEGGARLIRFLHEQWSKERPALVAIEQRMNVAGMLTERKGGKGRNSDASIYVTCGVHYAVAGMARVFLAPIERVAIDTHRKHFLQRARFGSREATNLAVVSRCRLMKLVPQDCADWDRCNALSVHDWACANFASKSASLQQLYLTGE